MLGKKVAELVDAVRDRDAAGGKHRGDVDVVVEAPRQSGVPRPRHAADPAPAADEAPQLTSDVTSEAGDLAALEAMFARQSPR